MFRRFSPLVEADAAAVALIDGATGEITSREALLQRANELAERLSAAGLRERDALAVQLPNSVDFVAAFLAACSLDLLFVPIDRDAPESEVAKIVRHFRIGVLLRHPQRSEGSQHATAVAAEILRFAQNDGNPNVPASARLLKLTSGSTGMPKGVVTTEANLIADCTNICTTMGIAPHDLNLGAIPFSHSYGFSNLVMPLVVQGTPVVFSNDYLPQSLVELANRFRCTVAPLIPMIYAHLITAAYGEFESIRTFISAGAPLPATTSSRFRERFGIDIHSFYGCSECGGITYDRRGGAVERGTVGQPLENVQIALDGARLEVRSDTVAAGALLDANTFVPFANGAFMTDDLVELRDDGEVALTGRAGDLINTAGRKVNPREVEAVILQLEGVREAKVWGEPAGARGEVVAVAVVATPDVTRERIREHCRTRLSLHKVPRIVKLIEQMPLDERGKVKRAALGGL